jgi:hypothetical protein
VAILCGNRLLPKIVTPLILIQGVIVIPCDGPSCYLIVSLVIQRLQLPLVLLQHLQHLIGFSL